VTSGVSVKAYEVA